MRHLIVTEGTGDEAAVEYGLVTIRAKVGGAVRVSERIAFVDRRNPVRDALPGQLVPVEEGVEGERSVGALEIPVVDVTALAQRRAVGDQPGPDPLS